MNGDDCFPKALPVPCAPDSPFIDSALFPIDQSDHIQRHYMLATILMRHRIIVVVGGQIADENSCLIGRQSQHALEVYNRLGGCTLPSDLVQKINDYFILRYTHTIKVFPDSIG
jgi:hypothetical protein